MEWTGARYADTPTAEVETPVSAPPERVWELVSDIGLMPRTSAELQSTHWLDGATAPTVGARFTGRSRHAALGEWTTTSHIVECERPTMFAWAVEDPQRPSATWRFTLTPHNGGTLLRHWVRIGPGPSGLSYAIDRMPDKEQKIVFVRLQEFESAMTATLQGIKNLAEGTDGAGA
ncbi:SRPBCC family protein [Streptomyces sp. NPDC048650]|uniref:SRPBCC family protein n=1 Tax=unclassified Streptomyces TaxID=2593676 RepID=UPI00371516DA